MSAKIINLKKKNNINCLNYWCILFGATKDNVVIDKINNDGVKLRWPIRKEVANNVKRKCDHR